MTHWRSAMLIGLLIVFGCVVGFGLSKSAYRIFRYVKHSRKLARDARAGYFSAYNVSQWEFDEQFGYVYPAGLRIDYTGVRDGRVVHCDLVDRINREGNIGAIEG